MAPVQKIYGEPRGLLASTAHEKSNNTITQSMCRIIDPEGKEHSACVACQTPCIDIDAERTYWDGIKKPDRKLIYYGYIGLVLAFISTTISMQVTGIIISLEPGLMKKI